MSQDALPMMPTQSQILELAPTFASLSGTPREVIDRLARLGFRAVQLSATQPGMRPRELDRSARRDLLSTLRRHGMVVSGIDLWIPPSHYIESAHADRAAAAASDAIHLASDLGRCPVSLVLPKRSADAPDDATNDDVEQHLFAVARERAVALADHAVPVAAREFDDACGVGIDPVAWLAAGLDPVNAVHEHAAHLVVARLSDLRVDGLRAPIGEADGRLDVTAYQVATSIANPTRPVVLDARQWPDPWRGIEQSASVWRSGEARRQL